MSIYTTNPRLKFINQLVSPIAFFSKQYLRCLGILALLVALGIQGADAQTTLSPGDLVFISYNAEGTAEDRFSIVLLHDVDAGTEILFTDLGWTGSAFQGTPASCGANMGSSSDGVIKWTATSAVTCGTEIYFDATTNLAVNTGTVSGVQATFSDATKYINLPSGGDQIFAIQGSIASPTFIAGIHMNSPAWDTPSACEFTSGKSALPASLSSLGFTIQPEVDNAEYDCSLTNGAVSSLQQAVLTVANWTQDNTAQLPLPTNCGFACNSNAPIVTMQPTSTAICPNFAATFTLTATNTTSYQWEVNTGSGFANATGSSYTGSATNTLTVDPIVGLDQAQFRCQLESPGGTSTSTTVTLTELISPSISLQPIDAISCIGCTTGFYTEVTGDGISYQWQVSVGGAAYVNLNNNSTYQGTSSNKLIISNLSNAVTSNQYKCVVTGTCTPSVETNTLSVSLTGSNSALSSGDVAVIAYNVDEVAPQEDNFSFVLLSDIEGGTEINITDYGWTDSGEFHNNCASTATTDGIIKWISTTDLSCGTEVVIEGKSKLTSSTGIVIGTQATTSNSSIFLTHSGSGDQLFLYQGLHSNPTLLTGIFFADDSGWNASYTCAESTSSKSTLPASLTPGISALAIVPEVDNGSYNCSVTTGTTASIRQAIMSMSNWTTDNITPFDLPRECNIGCNDGGPNIVGQPEDTEVCDGFVAIIGIFSPNATSYQWQVNNGSTWSDISNSSVYNGTNQDSLNINAISGLDGFNYRCIATNPIGNSTSLPIELDVLLPAQILTQPSDAQSCQQCSSGFSVTASGDSLTYQWQRSAAGTATFSNVIDDAIYEGSNTPSLLIASVPSSADGDRYRCLVNGSCSTQEISNPASLNLTGANTTLTEGDVAFASFNADDVEENISIILLTPIGGGTEINITDFGWTDDNAFQNCATAGTSDGIVKWVATEDMDCGSQINLNVKSKLSANTGVVFGIQATANNASEYIAISGSGDQIFLYQGNHSSPILIAGIYNANATGWDTALDNCEQTSSKSVLPSALTASFSAIQIVPEVDNARFDCSSAISRDASDILRADILNPNLWISDNTTPYTGLIPCEFQCCTGSGPTTVYVAADALGTKDGSSWANAFTNIQDALTASRSCGSTDSIKIANGIYYTDRGQQVGIGNRQTTFDIDLSVIIAGGYNSSTGLLDYNGRTILSGNLNGIGNNADNSYRVVEVSNGATLRDLTVEHGYDRRSNNGRGAGIYTSNGNFKNVIIRDNELDGIGAGLYATGIGITLENALIYGNIATRFGGGISLENTNSLSTLTNVTITDNIAPTNGAVDNFNSDIVLSNSILYNNNLTEVILFGSSTLTANNSIIQQATVYPGPGNSNENPIFIDPQSNNYRISECGPAVNTGSNADAPTSNIDLAGNPRIQLASIDMGAIEIQRQENRQQIIEIPDDQLAYSCSKKVELLIPNSTLHVEYDLLDPTLDTTLIGTGSDLILTSQSDAMTKTYTVSGSRKNARALTFANGKYINIPYEKDLAITADEDFTLEVGVNFNSISGITRFYSQEGSIGIGMFDGQLLITRYGVQDITTPDLNLTTNVDYVIRIEQKVIGSGIVQIVVYIDDLLFAAGNISNLYNTSTSDINIGGRPGNEYLNASLDFIKIQKGHDIKLRYDFTTGNESNTVFDYRSLKTGEAPRNGSLIGFDLTVDWVLGLDQKANLCAVEATIDVLVDTLPVNHYVNTSQFDGFGTLKYFTENSCIDDTIRFDPILDSDTLVFLGGISIPHNLNFIGNGVNNTIWDGNNDSNFAIFDIPDSYKILMKDLQITRAVESAIGSFYVSGDHTMHNLLFRGYNSNTPPPFRLDNLSSLTVLGELRIEGL